MDGILNILKPPGMTSFDVVAYLRGVLKTRKIGHTGTLDPEAVGVLPVCIGNATKAIEFMTDKDKTYIAEITLGIETDTQDATGNIISTKDVNVERCRFESVLKTFEGKINQIPPMYSAVKINGRKLYELAREGKTVERKPREVNVYSLKCIGQRSNVKYLMEIKCSKGTYIRTLCADIGNELSCGAHMSFLVRTNAGPFDIGSSIRLSEIRELSDSEKINERLISVEKVFEDLKSIILDSDDTKKYLNGVTVNVTEKPVGNELVRVYASERGFIALGGLFESNGEYKLKSGKLFLQSIQ
ncbi:MAG: tRNA pseudouridine(55) synthase TruB [Clostridia bacterium]|jgi:tRNA pseudouridine55 synthase